MDPVARQYEAYPYPERDPADEAKRLIVGSPSHPVEIDHFLFRGRRDWTQPFRVLVAGGGAGDALVMLTQLLADRGTPAEIHYLDLSRASRAVAEARLAARGLAGRVAFHSADLATAPELGPFDYIDCCGVLHHLPDPDAGFATLAQALAPEGGLGAMVYAPDGRRGVYEMQAALAPLVAGLEPRAQVALAREVLANLPPTSAFAQNRFLSDHLTSDAGLYDLLLHARDRPYRADAVIAALARAGLALQSFLEPARYEPATYLPKGPARARAEALDPPARAALAERLVGNMKTHVFYATRAARGSTVATLAEADGDAVALLHNVDPRALAKTVEARGALRFTVEGLTLERRIDRRAAAVLARLDGAKPLGAIAADLGLALSALVERLATAEPPLSGFNLFRFSRFRQ